MLQCVTLTSIQKFTKIEQFSGCNIVLPYICTNGHRMHQVDTEAFPLPLFRFPYPLLPRVGFFVSLTRTSVTRYYPVAIGTRFQCYTHKPPEKVGLPGSELPRWGGVMTSVVNNGSAATLCLYFGRKCELFTKWKLTIEM